MIAAADPASADSQPLRRVAGALGLSRGLSHRGISLMAGPVGMLARSDADPSHFGRRQQELGLDQVGEIRHR